MFLKLSILCKNIPMNQLLNHYLKLNKLMNILLRSLVIKKILLRRKILIVKISVVLLKIWIKIKRVLLMKSIRILLEDIKWLKFSSQVLISFVKNEKKSIFKNILSILQYFFIFVSNVLII
jgi:hypothetical protein